MITGNSPKISTCSNLFMQSYFCLDIYNSLITKTLLVKWFQVFLCITNNSIKYQSFVYTLINEQTVLFQENHLFALSLNIKQVYLTCREDYIRCYHSKPAVVVWVLLAQSVGVTEYTDCFFAEG